MEDEGLMGLPCTGAGSFGGLQKHAVMAAYIPGCVAAQGTDWASRMRAPSGQAWPGLLSLRQEHPGTFTSQLM